MDTIDICSSELPRFRIQTQASAEKWVEELILDMQLWRTRCDIPIPDKDEVAVVTQRRALWTFLTKHGEVVGALKTLMLCGMISDNCYRELNQKAINSLVPTIIGAK